MKVLANSLISGACVLTALAWPQVAEAQTVPLVFQTTFNCPEWIQGMGSGDATVCNSGDGIVGSGDWITAAGSRDQITTAANNPSGGGGRGFRHWVGDGINNGGGSILVNFPPVSEMWFRYYIRFKAGFRWNLSASNIFMKTIYCNLGLPGQFYFGLHDNVVGGHINEMPFVNQVSNLTWEQWQGGQQGDGNFHVLEVHAKMNTTATSSDGVFEFWLDDKLLYSNSNIHFAGATGAKFSKCVVGENHRTPQNGADAYVDFDDIAISATGWIGPPVD